MRNIRKASTLESKFQLLAVEQGCIISKEGDITVAYEITLPEIFTVTSQEYESVHAAWCKAIKVLPDYSIVHKLSRYSRQNAINKEWIDEYLNEAHSQELQSVRAHFNVLAWGEDMEELKHLRNDVDSQLASMECVPRHNTVDCPTLFLELITNKEDSHLCKNVNPLIINLQKVF